MTLVASITEPPPTATIRSAPSRRACAAPAITLTRRMGRDSCEDADATFGQMLREAARSGERGSAGNHQAMGAEGLGEIGQASSAGRP
jgi:hypothetical protein